MDRLKLKFEGDFDHFLSRQLLQTTEVLRCNKDKYEKCFAKCPPMIPDPPPPPASLKDYRRTWCVGHSKPWQCVNTNSGPKINGTNPRLYQAEQVPPGSNQTTVIALSVVLPIILIAVIVTVVLLMVRRRRNAYNKKKADNTYNLGYLSKPQAPTWTDNDGTEVAVEDGSEIFYQVDRTAALSAGINGGAGNSRSVPDVVGSSNATLRKTSPNNTSVFDIGRSGSATSQVPLLSSPEIAGHKRRMLTRTASGGQQDAADSDIGSPLYTRYGAASSHQPVARKHSHDPMSRGGAAASLGAHSGYMTYSPNTKSHPSLYSGGEKAEGSGTTIRTPKTSRQRSFGGADSNKPRPLRKPSGAAAVQRSDSMTLNRAGGRENYRNNWENFDEVTATMRRNKNGPTNRELVLGTDSFIESFTTQEPEEATSVDQLGLPTRNPFLQGFYDYEEDNSGPVLDAETSFGQRGDNSDLMTRSAEGALDFGISEHPPSYDEVGQPRRTPSVSMSQMPTLDLRSRRDRISEYDSEDSIEV